MRIQNQQKAGVLLSYINLGLGTIIPVFYTPIMLEIMGQAEYGLYALSHSVTAYLTLLNLGLSAAIGRYLAKCRAEGDIVGIRRLLGLFLVLYGCASTLVCVVGSGMTFLGDRLFEAGLTGSELERYRILVAIMTISVALSLPVSSFSAVITTYERFAFIKTLGICETVLIPVFNLVVLYLGKGSVGLALVGLSVQIISGIIYVYYCAKRLKIWPSFHNLPTDLFRELAGYCIFVVIATLVDMLYWSTDKVLIGAMIGTVAVAVYNVGGVFTSILQNMAHAISQVFTPRIMLMATKGERSNKEISELMVRVGRMQFYVVSFIVSGYIVFGKWFIRIWLGDGYDEAYYVALLTMIPLIIPLIQNVAFSTIMAQNKHRFRAITYLVIAIVNVLSTYLVLPYFGIIGAAVCTAVAFVLGNGLIMNIYYHRVIKLDIPGFWKSILSVTFIPLLMSGAGYVVISKFRELDNVWVFLGGIVAYSLLFWLLSWFVSMNQSERQIFCSLVKRKR